MAGTIDWRRDGALTLRARIAACFASSTRRNDGGERAGRRRVQGRGAQRRRLAGHRRATLSPEGIACPPLRSRSPRRARRSSPRRLRVSPMRAATKANTLTCSSRSPLASVSARHALQDLSDAAIEFAFEAGHLAKEPLGRLLDARADAARVGAGSTPGRATASRSKLSRTWSTTLLRGSPAADLRFHAESAARDASSSSSRWPSTVAARAESQRGREACRASMPSSTPARPHRWSSPPPGPAPRRSSGMFRPPART